MAAIGLLGDVMLGRKVGEELARVAPGDLWSPEVRAACEECDAVVANLECCVSDRGAPTERVPGKPFFFRAPPVAVEALPSVGIAAVGLANNHALDYETAALEDTLTHLDAEGIEVSGAGPSLETARRGVIIRAGDESIGIVAVSDHPAQFAAGADRPGIAYADLSKGVPDWLAAELSRLRAEADRVIAFPHWGFNMRNQPEDWQLRAAGELQKAGADLVAGHSAHVFHGIGWREGGPLVYDLGDALDDYAVDPDLRNDLGILAIWRPGGEPELELVGLALEYCFTQIAADEDAEWIARRLERACGPLGTHVTRIAESRFVVEPA